VSPDPAVLDAGIRRPHLSLVPAQPLRVVDVALLRGAGSGGIRTYLAAKAEHAARTGAIEHHVLVPRRPLGVAAVERALQELRPEMVLVHDPGWWPTDLAARARAVGAHTVAVHHGTITQQAAALPGPSRLCAPLLRARLRRAARQVDGVMSNVDTMADCGRLATMPLRLGVHEAYRPRPDVVRGDHVLYVGRLSREKGVLELLDAAARNADPWPLRLVGSGPLEETLRTRAERLGLGARISFRPPTRDPQRLARRYAAARCVVMPGEHETFGLVALEAAASGASVAACSTAPALHAIGRLGHGFVPGDPDDLDRAIAAARAAPADPVSAATLGWRHRWDRVFDAELASLRDLLG
jgi:glycosyltransferase involved in cell wall biosynthesis